MEVLRKSTLFKYAAVYMLIICLLLSSEACVYFKAKILKENLNLSTIDVAHRYFVLHTGSQSAELKDIIIDQNYLSGTVSFTSDREVFYTPTRKKKVDKTQKSIFEEAHVYLIPQSGMLEEGPVKIAISDIQEIRIINKDTGKTVLSVIGGIVGAFVLLMIIVALTKSSCPYVYLDNGEEFVFTGEIFGGSILKNHKREDYLPLYGIQKRNGSTSIRISNELKERQYVNFANLTVVTHNKDAEVLIDQNGQAHTFSDPIAPYFVSNLTCTDLLPYLQYKDGMDYMFNEEDSDLNQVTLQFKNPNSVANPKLLLRAKNSLWLDYIYGLVLEKFGFRFDNWTSKQAKLDPEDRQQLVKENRAHLSVYVKSKGKWKLTEMIPTVGPLAKRDFVIPLELDNPGSDLVEIKLETGFMFWDLDYVAMDFSDNMKMDVEEYIPSYLKASDDKASISDLKYDDQRYLAQEEIGSVVELKYRVPDVTADQRQSFFLHSKGYYELIRDFEGLPKIKELNKFKNPGYFSTFSREEYTRRLGPNIDILASD